MNKEQEIYNLIDKQIDIMKELILVKATNWKEIDKYKFTLDILYHLKK